MSSYSRLPKGKHKEILNVDNSIKFLNDFGMAKTFSENEDQDNMFSKRIVPYFDIDICYMYLKMIVASMDSDLCHISM